MASMAAARTLIQMAAERRRAATLDGAQHPQMQPGQPGPVLLDEAVAVLPNDVGHLEGWPVHRLLQLPGAFHLIGLGDFERDPAGWPAAVRCRRTDAGRWRCASSSAVAEQQLDGAQIRAGFQQVRREAMAQHVRARRALVMPARWAASRQASHSTFGVIGSSAAPVLHCAGKQIGLGLHPAPVHAQRLQQLLGSAAHRGHGRLCLGECGPSCARCRCRSTLQAAQLGAAHASRVQRHQHGAMEQIAGRVDQPGHLLRAQDVRQRAAPLGIGNILEQDSAASASCTKKNRRRGHVLLHGASVQLAFLEQVSLILPQI